MFNTGASPMSHTPSSLSTDQQQRYWDDGFLGGIPVLSPQQATLVRQKLIDLEAKELSEDPKRWARPDYQPWHTRGTPWWHWFHGMIRHPEILRAVEAILGPNILVRNADIFVKPAGSPVKIQWHVDTTASTANAGKMLTAWLALTDSIPANGALEWVVASHHLDLPSAIQDKSSLSYPNDAVDALETHPQRINHLKAGQMSLHHFRTVHRSGANSTDAPRIGLVIRFMAADTPLNTAESGKGILVKGENLPGHFQIGQDLAVSWRRPGVVELI
jgi:hypothetical protein